jgi:hypothetical protein
VLFVSKVFRRILVVIVLARLNTEPARRPSRRNVAGVEPSHVDADRCRQMAADAVTTRPRVRPKANRELNTHTRTRARARDTGLSYLGRIFLYAAFSDTPNPISAIALDANGDPTGRRPDGQASYWGLPILYKQFPWEGRFLENPSMTYDPSTKTYLLAYSAGDWWTPSYSTGLARCSTPIGLCTSNPSGPWLTSGNGRTGVGGLSFFTALDGSTKAIYASFAQGHEEPTKSAQEASRPSDSATLPHSHPESNMSGLVAQINSPPAVPGPALSRRRASQETDTEVRTLLVRLRHRRRLATRGERGDRARATQHWLARTLAGLCDRALGDRRGADDQCASAPPGLTPYPSRAVRTPARRTRVQRGRGVVVNSCSVTVVPDGCALPQRPLPPRISRPCRATRLARRRSVHRTLTLRSEA